MKFIFSKVSFLPRWIVLVLDLFLLTIGLVGSSHLRFNFSVEAVSEFLTTRLFLIYFTTYFFSIIFFEAHTGIIRYTQKKDAFNIMKAIVLANLLFATLDAIYFFYYGRLLLPPSVLGISILLNSTLLLGYRILVKEIFHYSFQSLAPRRNVVIYGAGAAGRLTANLFMENHQSGYNVLGFIDDNPKLEKTKVQGKTVITPKNSLDSVKQLGRIDELIIAINEITSQKKKWIIEECLRLSITVREVPSTDKWVGGILSVKQIKDVKVEDLLGRRPINVASHNAINAFSGKVVLVTGAAGSIGSEIGNQLYKCGVSKLLLLDQAESPLYDLQQDLISKYQDMSNVELILCDITNVSAITAVFDTHRPAVVFHAAAYKHVPLMENQPFEAVNTNVLGTKILADLASKHNAEKFVLISTDKAVNPTNVMGATKRSAEIYTQSLNRESETEYITTRFGNVLGSNGSVIPLFKKQIANGGPIKVTHPEITRFFMTIPEACSLVLEAGAMGLGGEIFVFDMGSPVKILDLAKNMIKFAGLELGRDIEIEFTGLRPGEKLYEEVLAKNENTKPTHHPKIMIADVVEHDHEAVHLRVLSIKKSLDERNEFEMVRKLKALVPEFRSTVSRFEVLDR